MNDKAYITSGSHPLVAVVTLLLTVDCNFFFWNDIEKVESDGLGASTQECVLKPKYSHVRIVGPQRMVMRGLHKHKHSARALARAREL
jgi:hypothetical protein